MDRRYWGEPLRQEAYFHNRLTSPSLKFKTLHESLLGEVPNNEYIRMFGCVAYVHHHNPTRESKSGDHVKLGVYLGTRNGLYRIHLW